MKWIADNELQQAYGYAKSLSNDHHQAKDMVHNAYLKMIEKNDVTISNTQAYLFRCIRNNFIDKTRFDHRWSLIMDEDDDSAMDSCINHLESITINQDLLKKLWATLKPLERELLYLWAIEEYTIDEISDLTNTARGTLLSRVHRIRKKISNTDIMTEVSYETTY